MCKEARNIILNAPAAPVKKKTSSDIPQATKADLLKYLTAEEYSDAILNVVNSYKTRVAINNGITNIYKDSAKGGALYNKLKPLLKEKGRK